MKKEYEYVVFSPYFGKLPVNFNLWLESCSNNNEFKFIVFTDDIIELKIPKNVEIINMTFDEFKEMIQKKFDFIISIDSPYKLCDFKPCYGYIFSDMLGNCKYWGHCDMDLIFGDLSKYIPKNDYDKIGYLGHFCLYKNNDTINTMFMNTPEKTLSYIDILSNPQHFGFDEIGKYCINNIFKLNALKIYNFSRHVADVDCRREKMNIIRYNDGKFIRDKRECAFTFENGIINSIDVYNKKHLEEFAYVHFQKRKMKNDVSNVSKFIIKYNSFIDYYDTSNNREGLKSNHLFDFNWIKYKIRAIKNRLKRYSAIKNILKEKD